MNGRVLRDFVFFTMRCVFCLVSLCGQALFGTEVVQEEVTKKGRRECGEPMQPASTLGKPPISHGQMGEELIDGLLVHFENNLYRHFYRKLIPVYRHKLFLILKAKNSLSGAYLLYVPG